MPGRLSCIGRVLRQFKRCPAARSTVIINGFLTALAIFVSTNPKRTLVTAIPCDRSRSAMSAQQCWVGRVGDIHHFVPVALVSAGWRHERTGATRDTDHALATGDEGGGRGRTDAVGASDDQNPLCHELHPKCQVMGCVIRSVALQCFLHFITLLYRAVSAPLQTK